MKIRCLELIVVLDDGQEEDLDLVWRANNPHEDNSATLAELIVSIDNLAKSAINQLIQATDQQIKVEDILETFIHRTSTVSTIPGFQSFCMCCREFLPGKYHQTIQASKMFICDECHYFNPTAVKRLLKTR